MSATDAHIPARLGEREIPGQDADDDGPDSALVKRIRLEDEHWTAQTGTRAVGRRQRAHHTSPRLIGRDFRLGVLQGGIYARWRPAIYLIEILSDGFWITDADIGG